MRLWRTLLIFFILTASFSIAYSVEITDTAFPFKGFIYNTLNIAYYDITNISVSRDTFS